MKFSEKLTRLLGDRDQAAVAEDAEITPAAMSSYVNGKGMPSVAAAIRLAEVLDCDLLWLVDDRREFDDDHPRSLTGIHSDRLIWELRQRYVAAAILYLEALRGLEDVDWGKAKAALEAAPAGKLPREAFHAANAHNHLFILWDDVMKFAMRADVSGYPVKQKLPPGVTLADLEVDALAAAEAATRKKLRLYVSFIELFGQKLAATGGRAHR